jgi:hypothetical protein
MARDTFDNKDELDAPVQTDGLGNALVIVTTLVLLVAAVLAQQAAKNQYNAGMFGEGAAAATRP